MFRLLRYFTITCGITSIILAITLGVIINRNQINKITHDTENQNIILSQLLANSIQITLPEYLETPDIIDPESLKNRSIVYELDRLLYSMILGLDLLKVKIYNKKGLTLYSSDPAQIGESKENHARFQHAKNRNIADSQLSFRDEFLAFSGVLYDRDIVETYIPILSAEGTVKGVFELYTDVTHIRTNIRHEKIWIFSTVTIIFFLFFAILFFIVRSADKIIRAQYLELEKNREKIQQRTEELYQQANYDSLTKLANRANMIAQLKHDLAFAARYKNGVALLFIDLDGFKNVNDTLGHDVGDQVLIVMADRLQHCVRDYDTLSRPVDSDNNSTIARLGGDEFTIIIPDLSQLQNVDTLAKRIILACTEPLEIKNNELIIGASIGVALYPSDSTDPTSLMRNADIAMYHAKQEGKNTFRYFTEELNIAADRRMLLEQELRHAIENHELELHYQPIYNTSTKKVEGAESLLRWFNKKLGSISPAEFIPLAEETGLIIPIGEWVLRRACIDAAGWPTKGETPPYVSVNISGRQLSNPDFSQQLKAIVTDEKLDLKRLKFEVTESVIIGKSKQVRDTVDQIVELDIKFFIDDFGTGYSSLSNLLIFPLEIIKIDQSFVRDINDNSDKAQLLLGIVALAKSMNMGIIAEGVETNDEQEYLNQIHCDVYQGWLFSKAIPNDEFIKNIEVWNK